jgi:hypothetical protein
VWTLNDYKHVFYAVGLVGVIGFSMPSLMIFLHLPSGEKFSELWVLGPGHMAEDYPFNVRSNETYMVYVGVGNHMVSSSYYCLYVKFRNQIEPLPNITAGMPSPLSPLYEYRASLEDGGSWEAPLAFSFSRVSFFENQSMVESLALDGVPSRVDRMALWDVENNGYYYQLFIELWVYSAESDAFIFHNRFVSLWLNMTG